MDKDDFMRRFVNKNRLKFLEKMETRILLEAFDIPSNTRERVRCRLTQDGESEANSMLLDAIVKRDNFAHKFITICQKEGVSESLVEIMSQGLRSYNGRDPSRRQNVATENLSDRGTSAVQNGRRNVNMTDSGSLQERENAAAPVLGLAESMHLTPSPIISIAPNVKSNDNERATSDNGSEDEGSNACSNTRIGDVALGVGNDSIGSDESEKKPQKVKVSQNQNLEGPFENEEDTATDENVESYLESREVINNILSASSHFDNQIGNESLESKSAATSPLGRHRVNISASEAARRNKENNLDRPYQTSKRVPADKMIGVQTASSPEPNELQGSVEGKFDGDVKSEIQSLHTFYEKQEPVDSISRQGSILSQASFGSQASSDSESSFFLNTSDLENAFPEVQPANENQIDNLKEETKITNNMEGQEKRHDDQSPATCNMDGKGRECDQDLAKSCNNAERMPKYEEMTGNESSGIASSGCAGIQCSEDLEHFMTKKREMNDETERRSCKNLETENDDSVHSEENPSNMSFESSSSQTKVKEVYDEKTWNDDEVSVMPNERKVKDTFITLHHPTTGKEMDACPIMLGETQIPETKVKQVDDEDVSKSKEKTSSVSVASKGIVLHEMNESISTISEASDTQTQQFEESEPVTTEFSIFPPFPPLNEMNGSLSTISQVSDIPDPSTGNLREASDTSTASTEIPGSDLANFSFDDDISDDNPLQRNDLSVQTLEEMNPSSVGSDSTNSQSSLEQDFDINSFLVTLGQMLHFFFPERPLW